MPFAEANAIQIHYRVDGLGPPLLMFAPGGFRSVIARWTAAGGKGAWKEMDGLTALSKHFTTIAYDRRECGQSGGRVEPLDWNVYALEAKAILDLTGATNAHVLGCCMGASLALAFAVRYPRACKSLILHWPVGGYHWMLKGREFFDRHIAFVREHGLRAVVERAPRGENFWLDPEIGPWGSPCATDPAFAARYIEQELGHYLELCARSRDTLFDSTFPSGASGEALLKIEIPALIMSGSDARHTRSASWTLKELLPRAELWNVFPPEQTGANTLAELLRFTRALG
jgi:pimeloyl-ACP methyl ester carboxylesterase